MSELLSPFAHLEKELSVDAALDLQTDQRRPCKEAVHDSIARLLMDVEDSLSRHALLDYSLKATLREVAVQTDNDPITDEAPEYAARPPPCKKLEMIPDMNVFEEIDKHAVEVRRSIHVCPSNFWKSTRTYMCIYMQPLDIFFTDDSGETVCTFNC